MTNQQVGYDKLQRVARLNGINPNQTIGELRKTLDIETCGNCGDEFVEGYGESGRFCTDGCKVEYLKKAGLA